MSVRLETFTNQPLLFKTKRGSYPLELHALGVNRFVESMVFLPKRPKNKTLLRVLKEDSIEAWSEVCSEIDIKKWTKFVLIHSLPQFFQENEEAKKNALDAVVDEYSIEFLFISFARQNQLELFWDIQAKPEPVEAKKDNEIDQIQNVLYLSTICSKLGISEINGQKISINNYLDVLTWPQYFYLTRSDSIRELIMFSNANNLFGSDEEKAKAKHLSNLEEQYEDFKKMMRSFCKPDNTDFEEHEYFSEEAERVVRARGVKRWIKLYEFFKEE